MVHRERAALTTRAEKKRHAITSLDNYHTRFCHHRHFQLQQDQDSGRQLQGPTDDEVEAPQQ